MVGRRSVVVRVLRWWFGLTYLLGGMGGVVAGPVMLGTGDAGGAYLIVGGVPIAVAGWALHPWGLERARRLR